MKNILLIDFGSTFTKVTAVDLDTETIVATAKSYTTVETNVMVGLNNALHNLRSTLGVDELAVERKIACSSAAGGLRMVAVGLVPKLTVEAARLAALSAGAKLVGAYSYYLTKTEIADIVGKKPDVILLAGGTDGGNTEVILHNAKMLAAAELNTPIVCAGNKAAQDEVYAIFTQAGKDVRITDNVLPGVNELNIEPSRQTIRSVFLDRIIHAKGIDKAMEYLDDILMPTPTAVLQAARLLADGTKKEAGLGDLIVVDVGGATTDVHSIGFGKPSRSEIIFKGLPEPYAKRTVEGDLGVRYNASSILETVGAERLGEVAAIAPEDVVKKIQFISGHVDHVPENSADKALDRAMAYCAVDVAVARHAGTLEEYYTPLGTAFVQHGKDLGPVKAVIGTGGPLVQADYPEQILQGSLYNAACPGTLKPRTPQFYLDREYILYAMGLLAESCPDTALRIMKKSIKPL